MSLRLRLLLAVGVVALTALAIADVVTYQELRSFLNNRIDQSLEQSHMPIESALGSGPRGGTRRARPRPRAGTLPVRRADRGRGRLRPRRPRPPPPPRAGRRSLPRATASRASPATCCTSCSPAPSSRSVARRTPSCAGPRSPSSAPTTRPAPSCPGASPASCPTPPTTDEETVYFTAPGLDSDDGQYRIRASVLDGGPYNGRATRRRSSRSARRSRPWTAWSASSWP